MKYAILHHSTMTDENLYFIHNNKNILLNNEKLINNFISYENYENYEKLINELNNKNIQFNMNEENPQGLTIIKKYNYRF